MTEYLNPLKEFYNVSGLSYQELEKLCKVPWSTLRDICKMDANDMKNLRMRTVLNIKKNLNIDLFKFMEKITYLKKV